MATLKQQKAFEEIAVNGGNVSAGMRKAGYTEITSATPKKLTESAGWRELMAENCPDGLLAKVLSEGLTATKYVEGSDHPDYAVRHKYADTWNKLKDKYPASKHEVKKAVFLVDITKEETQHLKKLLSDE